jgi:aspartate beta-hydroxylase
MSMFYDAMASMVRKIYDTRITGPAILQTKDYFPAADQFVGRWQQLRDEALHIAKNVQRVPLFHELLPEQEEISHKDKRDWRMFVLKAYGVPIHENLVQCPELARLVMTIPDVLSATLSFLAPQKHIPRHRGPFRGVIRFHLGLSVPASPAGRPYTRLLIDDQEHLVGNGDSLLWDDTYPHEVWNSCDEMRIALLLDIRRRHMPFDMTVLSRLLISMIGFSLRMRTSMT